MSDKVSYTAMENGTQQDSDIVNVHFAALLEPYVSEKNHWIIKHHGLFQGYYYFHFMDQDRDARDAFADHPHYQACVDFCARWDQTSFDPDYDSYPLAYFEPKVRALFAREPNSLF